MDEDEVKAKVVETATLIKEIHAHTKIMAEKVENHNLRLSMQEVLLRDVDEHTKDNVHSLENHNKDNNKHFGIIHKRMFIMAIVIILSQIAVLGWDGVISVVKLIL